MIHHVLEGLGRISETKWHYLKLLQAVASAKYGFPLISFSDPNQVKPVLEVHFGEPLSALNPVLQYLHQQEGVSVGDRYFVQPSVIHA